jgi:2-oxoglutarate ferredoxin oxidoreductase subunit alpha
MAPGDMEECFEAGANALNLAWKYQVPVIVLLDKILSEHSATSRLDDSKIEIECGSIALAPKSSAEDRGRYLITPDGISPMSFPGTPNTTVKVTSYEHDTFGITADLAEPVKAMIDKRFAKADSLAKELADQETVNVFGDKKSDNVIVFWGSTKGPVLEAAKFLSSPAKLVQILWMEPFDSACVARELAGAKKIIDVECNHNAQLAALIREKTGVVVTDRILKYDSRPFEPVELARELNAVLNVNIKARR